MKTSVRNHSQAGWMALSCLSLASLALQAQTHYPAGIEGIKAGSLPPPGVYLRDYNYLYFANDYDLGPPDFDLFAYVNAPRLIWVTDTKILGANYAMDVIVPLVYTDLSFNTPAGKYGADKFGLGDIAVEPLVLAWHTKKFDFAVGYAFWAPTGEFDAKAPESPGKGFWSNMFTAGATWYPDEAKTWAVSVLNRYELHTEQEDTDITPGNALTVEWGISKSLRKTIDVGLVGYYQQQLTDDSGVNGRYDAGVHDHALALGPEVSLLCPKLGLFTSVRYLHEVDVKDRPEGDTVTVTFTKRF